MTDWESVEAEIHVMREFAIGKKIKFLAICGGEIARDELMTVLSAT